MTMPHMMNCSHEDVGWCLNCVGELEDECNDLRTALRSVCKRLDDGSAWADEGPGGEYYNLCELAGYKRRESD